LASRQLVIGEALIFRERGAVDGGFHGDEALRLAI
jgi:hypothetical protein